MKTLLTSIVVFTLFIEAGSCEILTFEDLSPGGNFLEVPGGYGGLKWTNFWVVDAMSEFEDSGFRTGMVSPTNVVFDSYAQPGSLSGESMFNLDSGYFTAAWNEGLKLQVQGFRAGVLTYDNTYTLSMLSPLLINFNYVGVDNVLFTPYLELGSGHFVMDNLTVSTPEPGSRSLLLAAAGLFGLRLLRRRSGVIFHTVAQPLT